MVGAQVGVGSVSSPTGAIVVTYTIYAYNQSTNNIWK
jgi:hypothetical protein